MTEYVSSMSTETHSFSVCFEGVSGIPTTAGSHLASPAIAWGERTWRVRFYPGGVSGALASPGYSSCTLLLTSGPSCRASVEFKAGFSAIMTRKVSAKMFDATSREWGQHQMISTYDLECGTSSYIRDDSLAVAVTIKVYGEVSESTRPQSVSHKRKADGTIDEDKTSKAPRTADAGIASLFADKALADVSIVLADKRRVQAHKLILSMRSAVLKSMLTSRMSEATSNQIAMDDYTPVAVRAFVEYLYKETLPASCDADTLAELLGMAHKYQVGRLEDDCTERLAADIAPGSVLDVLQLAELYSSERLRAAAYGVLRGRGRETVKTSGFFERLEAYWAACALPVIAAASFSSSSGGASKSGKVSKAAADASSASSAVSAASVKKGGKASKGSKNTAATSKAEPAAPVAPAAASSSAAGEEQIQAPALRIPEEIREIIRALAESSAPPSTLPSSALPSTSASVPPPCQCRSCRLSRGEAPAQNPDEDEEDDDGENYDDEDEDPYSDGYADDDEVDEYGNPLYY